MKTSMKQGIDWTRKTVLLVALIIEGGLLVLACLLGLLTGYHPFSSVTINVQSFTTGLVTTIPLILLLSIIIRLPFPSVKEVLRLAHNFLVTIMKGATVVDMVIIAILAGIGEEFFFRGWMQPLLGNFLGPFASLIITSIVFGLAHCVTRLYAVMATIYGLYLGWLFQETGNLFIPIFVHALYDFIAFFMIGRLKLLQESKEGITLPRE